MIWATVSSKSCFCWLYIASPTSAAKVYSIWFRYFFFFFQGIKLFDFSIDHVVMFMCRIITCVDERECLLWAVYFLNKALLTFALLHVVLQDQTCLLLQVSLVFLLLHSNPLWWKQNFSFCIISRGSCWFS